MKKEIKEKIKDWLFLRDVPLRELRRLVEKEIRKEMFEENKATELFLERSQTPQRLTK